MMTYCKTLFCNNEVKNEGDTCADCEELYREDDGNAKCHFCLSPIKYAAVGFMLGLGVGMIALILYVWW